MMFMIYNTPYIDISITISTIQLYTGSLSGHTVRHLAVVQYTTLLTDENTRETAVYQMNRLTFGDGASPFVAIITLHKTAEDYGEDRARAITAIKENFYMDDYLDSFDTTEEAIQVGKEIQNILSKGDFNLTKWISNSVEIRKAFNALENEENIDVSSKVDEIKVLGVRWNMENDIPTFKIGNTEEVEFTRRGLLS